MNDNKVLRMGVIGAGRIGKIHAANIATRTPGAVLTAIADVDIAAAEETAVCYGVSAHTDYHDILTNEYIEAVAICSATDTHAQIIQDAASVGKHIFCEKPIDLSLEKIDATLAAVEKAGVKLQIGFNRRFDANFRKVRAMISAGQVGEPHILRITSRDPAPPPIEYVKVSGGMFLDMTIHDFDMARFLMGCEVEELFVAAAVRVDPAIGEAGDVDTAVITLKFANGAIGTIDNSRQAVYGYDQRVEVFGSEGMVAVSNNTADTHVYANATGVHSGKPLNFFLERYMDSYVVEMQAFVDAVLNNKPLPIAGEDGRIPVLMALAAAKSYQENQPIKLQEFGSNP
jgi:myo-inositol 2-dehydrogenase/D-chiro-inositol 1-dehydrogenase